MVYPLTEIPLDVTADARLERELATSTDPRIRSLLIEVLADRYTWLLCDKYLERIRQQLEDLPADHQHFPRAFLAALHGRCDEVVSHFVSYTADILKYHETPPDADFAWCLWQRLDCVEEFLEYDELVHLDESLSDLFTGKWPGSPIALYYQAWASSASDQLDETHERLSKVVSQAPEFWMASFTKGWLYLIDKEWQGAAECLSDAIQHEGSRRDPLMCYAAARAALEADTDAEKAVSAFLDCLERASGRSESPSANLVELLNRRLHAKFGYATAFPNLVESARDRWGETAYTLYLRGCLALDENEYERAIGYFVQADSVDREFWLAALAAARCYTIEENWNSAAGWFRRAIRPEVKQNAADVWFDAAWCFGKAKSRDEEIAAYQQCLKCLSDFNYASNNLGWALLKAGKYEEAVEVLRKAVGLEAERNYAIGNLARALEKLERYEEAIEVLKESKTQKGTLRKSAQRRITRLMELIQSEPGSSKEPGGLAAPLHDENEVPKPHEERNSDSDELDEDQDEGLGAGESEDVTAVQTRTATSLSGRPTPGVPLERILEALIEQKIQRGDIVFNRRLRIYVSSDGLYGRQYPIPGIGFIDLLAEDIESCDLVVIELKRDQATREVIGQVSEYAGWVKNNLAKPGQMVIPVICLLEARERLRNAAEAVGIEVFEYDLSFR